MKNYIKIYSAFLFSFAVLLAGCAAAQKESQGDDIVLNMAEVFTFDTVKPAPGAAAQALDSNPIHARFEHNSAELTPEEKENLAAVAAELCEYPGAVFTIIGHTDAMGEEAYNQILSERRALAVSKCLKEDYGVTNNVETLGKGALEPEESNETLSGRRANRRAEIIIRQ